MPHAPTIPMDTFRWIVSGLLGALVIGVGWFLAGIQTDLRDVRREMTGMRVESAVTNTKLEELIAEFRRRDPPLTHGRSELLLDPPRRFLSDGDLLDLLRREEQAAADYQDACCLPCAARRCPTTTASPTATSRRAPRRS